MANKVKQKRRLKKAIKQRRRQIEKKVLAEAWRNIFVKAGILEDMLR